MSIKKTLLAAAAVAAFAFMALPALASAAKVEYENPDFSVHGGTIRLVTPETELHCESVESVAETTEFENGEEMENEKQTSSEGMVRLSFKECTGPFGVNCTTSGQATGTILTTTLPFHIVQDANGIYVLITSNGGHFASFKCSFLASIEVTGNGILGTITKPGVGETSEEATVVYNQNEGVQEHTEVGGETYGLEASTNGGEAEPMALEMTLTVTFNGKATLRE